MGMLLLLDSFRPPRPPSRLFLGIYRSRGSLPFLPLDRIPLERLLRWFILRRRALFPLLRRILSLETSKEVLRARLSALLNQPRQIIHATPIALRSPALRPLALPL